MDYIIKSAASRGIYIGMVCIWGTPVEQGLMLSLIHIYLILRLLGVYCQLHVEKTQSVLSFLGIVLFSFYIFSILKEIKELKQIKGK